MNVLGIYGAFGWDPKTDLLDWTHNSGATLFCNGNHVASISEERLTKIKYDGMFPENSIRYCLYAANLSTSDIDVVCFCSLTSEKFYESYECNRIKVVLSQVFKNAKIELISHHVSHAAASVFSSPFNEGTFITLDGSGSLFRTSEGEPTGSEQSSIGYFNKKNKIFKFFPTVPGRNNFGSYYVAWSHNILCEKLKKLIDISDPNHRETYCGKVMGLSAYGNSKSYLKDYKLSYEGTPTVQFLSHPSKNNHNLSEINKLTPEDRAAFLQKNFEDALIDYLKELKKESYLDDNLCLSGGVFLNILANTKIIKEDIAKNVYIPPFTSDCGLSFGCAAYQAYKSNEQINLPHNLALLGLEYSNQEIEERLIKSNHIHYEYYHSFDSLCEITSKYLHENKIVGWFQNRSEFGPRALGSRSLLMNPKFKGNKEILNSRVKHREYWRPFAGIMLEEYVSDYFEEGFVSPYMLYSQTVKQNKIEEIDAIVHEDNTCRIQTVNQQLNPEVTTLLKKYNQLSKTPILLNTSFNDNGQPIVETPQDAIDSFLNMDIDILVIGNFLVRKK